MVDDKFGDYTKMGYHKSYQCILVYFSSETHFLCGSPIFRNRNFPVHPGLLRLRYVEIFLD